MKKLHLFFSLFIVLTLNAQNKSKDVSSKIDEVVVYFEGAQVKRTASSRIEAGTSEIVFGGISPNIDKQSLRVKGKGKFTIMNVVHQNNHLNSQKSRQEIKDLENKKNQLTETRTLEDNIIKILDNEKTILTKNQSIAGNNTGLKTLDLKEAVDFHRNRLTEIYKQQTDINKRIFAIDTTLQGIDKQLKALNQSNVTSTSDVIVTIKANDIVTKADFEISYFVKDAGWFADYDLRVKDIASPINWVFKANIFQNSGEDWKNVKMAISSGNPNENGVAPPLKPWYLSFNSRSNVYNALQGKVSGVNISGNKVTGVVMEDDFPLPGATIVVKGTAIGTTTDFDGKFSISVPNPNSVLEISYIGFNSKQLVASQIGGVINLEQNQNELEEVVVVGYGGKTKKSKIKGVSSAISNIKDEESYIPLETKVNYQPTTINYEIKEPFTVLNNKKIHKTDIKTFEVEADFEYVAVPKIDKAVYLNAKIINWQDLNLFDGEINLFFEDEYQGKSLLNVSEASDTLNISLGKDKSLVIERKPIKDFTSKQFLSSYKTETKAYEILVRNNKNLPIDVVIYDQFPITTNKEITIDKMTFTGAQLDEKTNILKWKINLLPKTEKKMDFRYQVKYPKYQNLYLD
jgi:hypothetical protein